MEDRNEADQKQAQRFLITMSDEMYWALCELAAKDHREPKAEVIFAVERLLAEAQA